jgi:zinc protease
MKKISVIATTLFLIINSQNVLAKEIKTTSNTQSKTTSSSIKNYFTSNGIEVISKKITSNEIVGIKLFLRGGSLNINDKNAGIEKILFNTMLQGSKSYPKDLLNEESSKYGIQISSESFFDYSVISIKTPNKYLNKAVNILQSIVTEPLLTSNELELQKNKTISLLKQKIDDPDEYIWKIVNKNISEKHPYYNEFEGEIDTVKNISESDLKKYYKDNFIGSKLLLVVAGNFDDKNLDYLQKSLSKLEKGSYKVSSVKNIEIAEPKVVVEDRDIPTSYIAARFAIPTLKDKDYPATYLALRILSEKMHESVRTKHGLSYAVYSGASQREANTGYIYVTTVKPKESIDLIFKEIETLKSSLVDKKQLEGVINLYYTQYFLNIESPIEQAGVLGANHIIGKDFKNSYTLLEKLKKVTPMDIKDVMNKYVKNLRFGIIYKKDLINESDFSKL